MTGNDTSDQIPTTMRLLAVLEAVAKAGVPVRPSEINAELGLPKPTIHRLFKTLEDEGFLQRDLDGKAYSPGRRMRQMAANAMSAVHVRTARLAILTRLSEEVGETCNLAIPDRDRMIYLDRVETKWPLRIQLPIGTRVPLHSTASGKVYLSSLRAAYLDRYLDAARLDSHTPKTIVNADDLRAEVIRVRKSGFATDDEEFMEGMTAIACPIRDEAGRMIATVSIHAPVQRISLKELLAFRDRLEDAAHALASLLLGDAEDQADAAE